MPNILVMHIVSICRTGSKSKGNHHPFQNVGKLQRCPTWLKVARRSVRQTMFNKIMFNI